VTVPTTTDERRFPHLTEMQEAFVTNYVANGGNGAAAARAAGYAKSSARIEASKLLKKQHVIGAIGEESVRLLASLAPGAIARVAHLTNHAKSEYVQLEAAKDVLTRVGLAAPQRVHHSGGISFSIEV
jgi:phage terminase small subunit